MIPNTVWIDKGQVPKVVGECAGCQEDILENEAYYDFQANGCGVETLVHQTADCCFQFVSDRSVCRGAIL